MSQPRYHIQGFLIAGCPGAFDVQLRVFDREQGEHELRAFGRPVRTYEEALRRIEWAEPMLVDDRNFAYDPRRASACKPS